MNKSLILALVAAAGTLGAGAAHAGGVSWSIGINTPVVGTVISNGPGYHRGYGPGVYLPAPPLLLPLPVYRESPVAYYPPRSVYVRPVPVVYPRHYREWRQDRRDDRRDGWRDDRGWHRD